jgi:hypothetical protein
MGDGFTVGTLRIAWRDIQPWQHPRGIVYHAILDDIGMDRTVPRESAHAALIGQVVQLPDGTSREILGVESPASIALHAGSPLGLLFAHPGE